MQECVACKLIKSLGDFGLGGTRPRQDGSRLRNKKCKACFSKESRERRAKSPEKYREESRRQYRENPASRRASARKWYALNTERAGNNNREWRERNRFRQALVSSCLEAKKRGHIECAADIEEIAIAFTGYCAICGEEKKETLLRMDHDHKTGRFRGWLCHNCNVGLGHFMDNSELLLKADTYLKGIQ